MVEALKNLGCWLQADYVKYTLVMDHARTEVRKEKRRHESNIAINIKTDPKMFHKYARSKMDVKEGIGSLKDEYGKDTADLGKVTCILNQNVATVFTEEDLSGMPVPTNMCNSDDLMTLANQQFTRNCETWTQRKQQVC